MCIHEAFGLALTSEDYRSKKLIRVSESDKKGRDSRTRKGVTLVKATAKASSFLLSSAVDIAEAFSIVEARDSIRSA